MRRKITLFIILLLSITLLFSFSYADVEETNLIYNGDFYIVSEDAKLPAGWDINAYNIASDALDYSLMETDDQNYLYLYNINSNDARFVQNVGVEPNTVYELTCEIATKDVKGTLGATISIDNYGIDKTYCYSEPIFGTEDWQTVTLYVKSASNQKNFRVALRLGGYSMEATGTAFFKNIEMYKCDGTPVGATVINIKNDTGLSDVSSSNSGKSKVENSNGLIACITSSVIVLLLFAILYFKYLRYENINRDTKVNQKYILLAVLILSVLIRIVLSIIFKGHSTDINCFMAWGNAAFSDIPSFYTSGMFADYPPGYMYILALLTGICKIFNFTYGSAAYVLMFKLPATIADVVTAYLLYKLALKNGISVKKSLILASLYALNPVAMFISGAWGQIDSILALGLVLVLYLLQNKKEIIAGAVYGLVILLKPQALMLGPIIALAYFIKDDKQKFSKRILKTVLSVLAAVLVIFLGSLPFKGTQNFGWLIDKYIATSGSYDYASIEAFNFFSIFNGNWAPADNIFIGVSYKTFGTICICLSCAFAFYLYIRSHKSHKSSLYLCSAVMLTLIFTFGHYMHERYLFPVLILILVSYIYEADRRLLLSFLMLSAVLFFNTVCAMYIVDHQSERNVMYRAMTTIGSVAETISALYLLYISIEILIRNRTSKELLKQNKEHTYVKKKSCIQDINAEKKIVTYSKKEIIFIVAFTLLYGTISLLNLGTTKSPQTYWESDTLGEEFHVSFNEKVHVEQYWVFCNIGSDTVNNSGSVLLEDKSGNESLYEQTYDNMFRWQQFDSDFYTDDLKLSLYSGEVKINEIAFFDENGKLLKAHISNASGTQSNLLDEQDTVPDEPSYYNGMYFDELYHARTAYEHLNNLQPYENSHPPLGKVFIMLGVLVFGMCPFGWRIAGALFGILMIPIMYAFGKRLFNKITYAWLLTILFTFDFMHFTQTRIATIDVFGVFFILLMYYFMYRYICMNYYTDGLKATLKPLALSGLFFGFGIACKWICFYAGAGLTVLFFLSLYKRFKEYKTYSKSAKESDKELVAVFHENTWKTLLWCVLFFIVIPFFIYYLSYMPYYIYEKSMNQNYSVLDTFKTLFKYQDFMFSYHSGLKATHPYQSSWYQWPFTIRPMWYYFRQTNSGLVSSITASGNPAVWWIGTIGTIVLFILWFCNRVKMNKQIQLIFIGILANFVPWILVTRCTFIYHFFATVPFILMGSVYLLEYLESKDERLYWIKYVWAGLAIILFIALYPGISGMPINTMFAQFIKNLPGGNLMYGV